MDLGKLTALQLAEKIKQHQISVLDGVKYVFDQIEAKEDKVHAYLDTYKKEAYARAKEVQKGIEDGTYTGPLAGVPIAIKDNICIKGKTTTCASKILENFVPQYNAEVIDRLEQAGLVIIGKTNMDEFAMGSTTETSAYGVTRNPWDLEHVPGGSSGGSCAAVAAGETYLALGSDTGGSIRQPASFTGIVGLKPTYGLVSRYGLLAFASSLDQIGPLTKDVTDAAIVLNAIAGYDHRDSTSIRMEKKDYKKALIKDVKGFRIGVPREFFGEGIGEETKEAIKSALAYYEKEGAEIVDVSIPHITSGVDVYYIIAPAEASSNLARYDGVGFGYRASGKDIVDMYIKSRSTGFGEEVKRRIMIGNYVLSAGYYDAYYLTALKVRTLLKREFEKAFERCDILAAPSASGTAFKFGAFSDPLALYMEDICTVPVNLIGAPSISIPVGFKDGMPLGMQLIGPTLGEEKILQAAYTFEQDHPEFTKTAPKGEFE